MHRGCGNRSNRSLALIGVYFPYPTFFTTNFRSSFGNKERTFSPRTPVASEISRGPTGIPAARIAFKIIRCFPDISQRFFIGPLRSFFSTLSLPLTPLTLHPPRQPREYIFLSIYIFPKGM